MLGASYSSLTPGGNITGSFYGQVWVSGPMTVPAVTFQPGPAQVELASPPSSPVGSVLGSGELSLYQGEQVQVDAKIAYSNGSTVTHGEYTAMITPSRCRGSTLR